MAPSSPLGIASRLAEERGWAVFPCLETKAPACPHGFKQASADPDEIKRLWREHWGPLVGVATGERSGIDVLDVDREAWFLEHRHNFEHTQILRTRRGGWHVYFEHRQSMGNTAGRIAPGVDTRGDGGHVIFWHRPISGEDLPDLRPLPWPQWLLDVLLPKPKPPRPVPYHRNGEVDISGLIRAVERAPAPVGGAPGARNATLFWACCRCAEHIRQGTLTEAEAYRWMLRAALFSGLSEREADATIRSGLRS